ncbi:MAG: tryptophan 2,3-dioxygenase [Bradymonadaceae bacterium]
MSDDDTPDGCPVHGSGGDDERPDADDLVSYGSYLKVPELLDLQQPESDPAAHDELLFITIHQAYELWFKEVIFELLTIRDRMQEEDVYEAQRLLGRVLKIEELLVDQIHLLETMQPRDFLAFRKALKPASGFQSIQFREVEFLTGIQRPEVLEYVELNDEQRDRLERRLEEPSLRETFFALLDSLGFDVVVPEGEEILEGEERDQTVAALLEIYGEPREHYHIYTLAESLVEHDQKLLMWRYHHVRVVERLLGAKTGTGGSPGVEYLESTLENRAYPLLWEVRGELSDEDFYGIDPLAKGDL